MYDSLKMNEKIIYNKSIHLLWCQLLGDKLDEIRHDDIVDASSK